MKWVQKDPILRSIAARTPLNRFSLLLNRFSFLLGWALLSATGLPTPAATATPQVLATDPAPLALAEPTTSVQIDFDEPVDPATVDASSFRVFGRGTGTADGTLTFANGNRRVTFDPSGRFSAGEAVVVNLSHDIRAADGTPLRAAGYAFEFAIATAPGTLSFSEFDVFTNRAQPTELTRIYGAAAADLDGDGFLDLATVNEASADLRVALNSGDGTPSFGAFLAPQGLSLAVSPNQVSDFDHDGHTDLVIAASADDRLWFLRGQGDGTFSSSFVTVGDRPHGVVVLDADGDGDPDVAVAHSDSDDLALLLNDGLGGFGAPQFFDGGVFREYGLAAGDMNGDGITDLVVGAQGGQQVRTLLGDGQGGFTGTTPQASGGLTWVVVLGDVNGDGRLDAATANSFSGNGGILLGNGDGTFGAATLIDIGAHVVSTDLGDLDGDGDLDLVLSSFGASLWRLLENDGAGGFTQVQDFPATLNPSCAVLFDADQDGDLDLALTDEISDEVRIQENVGSPGFDADLDGVPDALDNCVLLPNGPALPDAGGQSQLDRDGDEIGNLCDCDYDNDGFCAISDFNVFLLDFQSGVDQGTGTDMDGDGGVGIGDFNRFLPGFQAGVPGPSGPTP